MNSRLKLNYIFFQKRVDFSKSSDPQHLVLRQHAFSINIKLGF